MPNKPRHPCTYPGCDKLVPMGKARCEEHTAQRNRPNSNQRGYDYRWQQISAEYRRNHPWCEYPGCVNYSESVHHIIPRSQGGTDDDDNLMALCLVCHGRLEAVTQSRVRRELRA